jgi:hypothetical protein
MQQDHDDAVALKVTATPEYFVNGRPMPSFGQQQLQTLVSDALQSHVLMPCRPCLPRQRIHDRSMCVDQREHEQDVLSDRHGVASHHGRSAHHRTTVRMAFYGFAWALCPSELQADEVCRVCAERVVTAIADLATLDALDDHDAAG